MPQDMQINTPMPLAPSVKDLLGPRYTTEMRAAFPDVPVPYVPFGYYLLVQLRAARKKVGSIIMPDEKRDMEKFRTQAALVRVMGPSCFKRRDTLEEWPEKAWCNVGEFVRIPMYGGDRYEIVHDKEEIVFVFVRDTDLIGGVVGDPLTLGTS